MSKQIEYTKGIGVPHKTFEDDFLSHKKCSEWWYSTGYFTDESEKMYTYQYTLANVQILGIRMHMLLTAITDIEKQKHYYNQDFVLLGRDVRTDSKETSFGIKGVIKYNKNEKSSMGHMTLSMSGQGYNLDITLEAKKEPVWHCENGKLKMGILDDPKQITYYFSFTNLVVNGKLNLDGVDHIVKGKAWYDKQGGTYSLTNYRTNWEWFSFRFFNDEELMLFYFPQSDYKDGTYIKENGDYHRINNYTIEPLDFISEEKTKYNFSYGWKITIPQLEGVEYTIKPKTNGQFNVFFYELIADIFDKDGNLLGYCFVELLPGARNKKINSFFAFKKK